MEQEPSRGQLAADLLEQIAARFLRYAQKVRDEGDALVRLADHEEYTDLTYRQLHRMVQNGSLPHLEMPLTDVIWVRRSDLENAVPAPVGRPPKTQ